jgi:uncharacterized membrane protein YbhN (UPF0104 family)
MLFLFMIIALVTNFDAVLTLVSHISLPEGTTLMILILGAVVLLLTGIVFVKKSKRIAEFVAGIGDGIKSVMTMKNRTAFILHTFFIWIMYFLMSYVLYSSMKGSSGISIFDSLWVMVSGGFGMVFPAPGGIGSYQWAVTLGFQSLGYDKLVGVAVGNVVWLTQTAMIIFSGALGYILLAAYRFSLKKAK